MSDFKDVDQLINFINENNININVFDSDEPLMRIWIGGNAYSALAKAFPSILPHTEDYNTSVNGHFDLSKTSLHQLKDDPKQNDKDAEDYSNDAYKDNNTDFTGHQNGDNQ